MELERLILVALAAVLMLGIRTVADGERLVVFRAGRYAQDIRGSGTTWIIPFFEMKGRKTS